MSNANANANNAATANNAPEKKGWLKRNQTAIITGAAGAAAGYGAKMAVDHFAKEAADTAAMAIARGNLAVFAEGARGAIEAGKVPSFKF